MLEKMFIKIATTKIKRKNSIDYREKKRFKKNSYCLFNRFLKEKVALERKKNHHHQ